MTYEMTYAHSDNDMPGLLFIDANNDIDAMARVRKFVSDGFRGETWGSIGLKDGKEYICRNHRGNAICSILEPLQ